ncbi:MAG: hypothetical protein CYG59_20750 [Chloroflexi bacterium]|nr:MAG: hypothetical protein CYG59_20750 [Chloroflexota bacterium]
MRYLRYVGLLSLSLLVACGSQTATPPSGLPSAQAQAQPTRTVPTAVPSAPATVVAQAQVPTLVPTQAVPTSAPAQPTPTSQPISAPATSKTITITAPNPGAVLDQTVTVRGTTNFWPFEATLAGQVKDAQGNILGMGPIMVQAPDIGQGGPFEGTLTFTPPAEPQTGILEIFETSAKDGSIVVQQNVPVQLGGVAATSGIQLDSPAADVAVTLPLHVAFRGADANAALLGRLRWSNGTVLEQLIPVVTGTDGVGYGVANLQWNTESAPPPTPAGDATFELAEADGAVLKRVTVQVLPDDATQRVDVAWTGGDMQELIVFQQRIARTPQVASAALRELLNGPPDGNAAGAQTALPTAKEIVAYPGRQPDWGYEVTLLKLTITDGVATANFSKELRAYGGGAARVQMIRQQIERTLRQFPAVQQVVIQIEGESAGVLEP